MFLYLHVGLNLLIFCSVSAPLPSPQDVHMKAVDMNYTLHWTWNHTEPHTVPVTFTTEYTYWDKKNSEGSYKCACNNSRDRWCDFKHGRLSFSGSYAIRVRAETGQQQSNWTECRFTPDVDVLLGPPKPLKFKADMDTVILTISESVMSSEMKLKYRVVYWEQLNPEQRHQKVYDVPYAPLTSLKPWTVYCVQVSAFSLDYNKSSNFTSAQCVSTTGEHLVWPRVLAVLCIIPLLGVLVYSYFWLRKKFTSYKIPDSIMGLPLDHPPLLEAQEMECAVPLVTKLTPQLEPPQLLQINQDVTQELQATSQWSSTSEQDSGICSGEES